MGVAVLSEPVDQRLRIYVIQAVGMVFAAILLLTRPAVGGEIHEIIEFVGFGSVLACVAGRMWSILYVGSKKNSELVTSGPYSITRNPLYFFSTFGAVGIGLIHGSVFVAFALGLLTYVVLAITASARRQSTQGPSLGLPTLSTPAGRRYSGPGSPSTRILGR